MQLIHQILWIMYIPIPCLFDLQPQSIAFNSDGTKLFILGAQDDDVNEYTLGIAYCLDNPSFVDSFSVTSQEELPTSVAFNTVVFASNEKYVSSVPVQAGDSYAILVKAILRCHFAKVMP